MEKILVCEAAKLMKKSNLFVYEAMKREALEGKEYLGIGVAMQMPGSTKWSFSISPTKLAVYLGIDVPTLNERLEELRKAGKQSA